MTAAFSLHKNR